MEMLVRVPREYYDKVRRDYERFGVWLGPLNPVWYGGSTLRLLFPKFCNRIAISNPITASKYVDAFCQWIPGHIKELGLEDLDGVDGLPISNAIQDSEMKLYRFCKLLCLTAGLKLPPPKTPFSNWAEVYTLAEKLLEFDSQYGSFFWMPTQNPPPTRLAQVPACEEGPPETKPKPELYYEKVD